MSKDVKERLGIFSPRDFRGIVALMTRLSVLQKRERTNFFLRNLACGNLLTTVPRDDYAESPLRSQLLNVPTEFSQVCSLRNSSIAEHHPPLDSDATPSTHGFLLVAGIIHFLVPRIFSFI
jgi:hypothetical protein